MKKEEGIDIINRLGLAPVYTRAEIIKRELAYNYCIGILNSIDNWESIMNIATRSFRRSAFYGRWIVEDDLGTNGKIVFFWKTIADEIAKNSKEFYLGFPEKFHYFSEENFQKLCDWLESQRWSNRNEEILKSCNIDSIIDKVLKEDVY